MTKFTTISDLEQWVRDRVDASVSDEEVAQIANRIQRDPVRPHWGTEWEDYLETLPLDLCELNS